MDITSIIGAILSGLSRGMIYALMSTGLALILGILNVPNFAQGEFYMIGAYLSWFSLVYLGFHPVVSLIIALSITFIIGMACDRALFRPLRKLGGREWLLNVFVFTLGLSVIFQNTALVVVGPLYYATPYIWGPEVINILGARISIDRLMIIFVASIVISALWIFLKYTKLGRAIRAVAQDSEAASLMGVNIENIYMITFSIGCALSAIAGALMISITPVYPMVGSIPTYKSWFVIILSGLGTIGTCIPMGVLLGIIETLGALFASEGWQNVIYLVIACIILIFRPYGIFKRGVVKGIWER